MRMNNHSLFFAKLTKKPFFSIISLTFGGLVMKEVKRNIIKFISLLFVVSAVTLQISNNISKEELYNDISFEYINTKDMATAKIADKSDTSKVSIIDSVFTGSTNSEVEEIKLPNSSGFQEVSFYHFLSNRKLLLNKYNLYVFVRKKFYNGNPFLY